MEVVNYYQITRKEIEKYLLKYTFSSPIFRLFIFLIIVFSLPIFVVFFSIDPVLKIEIIDHFISLFLSSILIYQYLREKTLRNSKIYFDEYCMEIFTQQIVITEYTIVQKNLELQKEKQFSICDIKEIREINDVLFLKTMKKEIIILKKDCFQKGTIRDVKTILQNRWLNK